jgi:hypothetical protein
MKRDVIVGKLIKEGFSANTLVKFNDKQLVELASRIISEGDVMISKKDPQYQQKIASAKKLNQSIETYEQKLVGGQKKLDKNHNGKIDGQDFKILQGQKKKDTKEQTVPLGSTPGLGDNPGSTELDNVTVTAKKTPTLDKLPKLSSTQPNPQVNSNTSQQGSQKIGRLKTFANDMKSGLSDVSNVLKPVAAIPASVVNAIGGQIGFKGRSEDQKRRGDLNRDSKPDDVQENKSELKEWVKNLAESNYHSFTSKNEIMELIGSKLNESDIQYGANVKKGHNGIPEFMTYDVIKGDNSPKIAPAKPKVDPGTKPKRQSPFQPGPGQNPKPKALKEDGDTKTAPAKPKVDPGTKPKRQSPFQPGPGPNPKPKASKEENDGPEIDIKPRTPKIEPKRKSPFKPGPGPNPKPKA